MVLDASALLAYLQGEAGADRSFEQRCKQCLTPHFIWHIWDGRKRDGFHDLVNYYKLAAPNGQGRWCLEFLTYSYLGDWITRRHDGINRGEPGAEDHLAAALELQARLDVVLIDEPPYDIFVRCNWPKDRGKKPHQSQDQFPWFWRDGEFTAERVNDVHLSPAGKQADRIHVDESHRSVS